MTSKFRSLNVFLCHASYDKPQVRKLYDRLSGEGWITPWLDEENLLPGQDWRTEISYAVRKSDVVIVCLSKASVNKEGFVQKEIKYALDLADEKPEGTIFIIPLKLEECIVPNRLEKWHWVNYSLIGGYEKLLKSLIVRIESLNISENITKQTKVKFQKVDSLKNNKELYTEVTEKKQYSFKKIIFFWTPIFIVSVSLFSYLGVFTLLPIEAFWLAILAYCLLLYYGFQNHISNRILGVSIFFDMLSLFSFLGVFTLLPIEAFWLVFIGFALLVVALLVKGL